MRILFFWPGVGSQPSIGVPLLMTILKNAGHAAALFSTSTFLPYPRSSRGMMYKVSSTRDNRPDRAVYDSALKLAIEAFIETINTFKPDVIGMSAMSTNYLIGLDCLRELKDKPFVLVGGVHATLCPEKVLEHPLVDAVCIGEAEKHILEFADKVDSGAIRTRDFSGVSNCWFKDKDSRIVRNETGVYADIEKLPLLDPEFVGTSEGYFVGKKYVNVSFETSRGCPFRCNYCCNDVYKKAVFGSAKACIRRMSPQRSIAHIQNLKDKCHVTMVRFIDENLLTATTEWLEEFCRLYKEKIGLPFQLMASANTITDVRIKLLKDAGCVNVNIGVESGNEHYRMKVLNKPITDNQMIKAQRTVEDNGIRISGGVMIGLPGQTKEIVWDTIRLIRDLRMPISNEYFVPLPGSPMYDEVIKNGTFRDFQTGYDCYSAMGEPVYFPDGMTKEDVVGIARTTLLYAHLPESLWPTIAKCIKDDEESNRLLDSLEAEYAF